jgi:hypothetical protein
VQAGMGLRRHESLPLRAARLEQTQPQQQSPAHHRLTGSGSMTRTHWRGTSPAASYPPAATGRGSETLPSVIEVLHDRSDSQTELEQVLASNERRLDALDRQGRRIVVDGSAVLEYLLDRARAHNTERELRLSWVRNVAGMLNHLET